MAKVKKSAVAIDIVEAMLPQRDKHPQGNKGWRADVLKEIKAKLSGSKNLSDVTIGVYFSYALRSIEGRKRREYKRTVKGAPKAAAAPKAKAAKKSDTAKAGKEDKTAAAMDAFLRGEKVGAPKASAKKKAHDNDTVYTITSPDGKKTEYFASRETAEATAAQRGKGWTVGVEE